MKLTLTELMKRPAAFRLVEHTLADPTKEWEGFRPTAYRLVPEKVCRLTLMRVEQNSAGQEQTTLVKLGEVLRSLADRKILESEYLEPTRVTTDAGELVFEGPAFSREVLGALADLRKDGINGFEAGWFWYDADSVRDMPQDSYAFFVVHGDKIVREHVAFSDYHASGFDPSIFTADEGSPTIWRGGYAWKEADIRYWYRKFYQDTRTGQLMVLRDDAPELYYYAEGRWRPHLAFGLLYDRIARIHSTLWITVVLLALLAGILLWRL